MNQIVKTTIFAGFCNVILVINKIYVEFFFKEHATRPHAPQARHFL